MIERGMGFELWRDETRFLACGAQGNLFSCSTNLKGSVDCISFCFWGGDSTHAFFVCVI
jgi:hypothetical protein